MIVPVQPRPAPPRTTHVADRPLLAAVGGPEWPDSPPAPEETRTPSIQIGSLVVESTTPISTAAIRDGFREAWLRHDDAARRWTSDAFRGGLTIDLPPGITGRELGRRLAEAILQRARVR